MSFLAVGAVMVVAWGYGLGFVAIWAVMVVLGYLVYGRDGSRRPRRSQDRTALGDGKPLADPVQEAPTYSVVDRSSGLILISGLSQAKAETFAEQVRGVEGYSLPEIVRDGESG